MKQHQEVNRKKASDTASSIGNGAIAIAADVTKEADWTNVAKEVETTFGRADILVHAAGIYPMASLDQMTPDEWRKVMAAVISDPRRFRRPVRNGELTLSTGPEGAHTSAGTSSG